LAALELTVGEMAHGADADDLGDRDGDADVDLERKQAGFDLFLEIGHNLEQAVAVGHERD